MEKKHNVKLDPVKGEATSAFRGRQERIVIITPEAFVGMMKVLNATFSTAGFTMCFLMGENKGHHDASKRMRALKEQGIVFTNGQIIESVLYQNRISGWGAPELHEYNEEEGNIIIRVENNPIAAAWGKAEKAVCFYLRGYWKGVVSETLEQQTTCTETKCISKGDPYCEFVIKTEAR